MNTFKEPTLCTEIPINQLLGLVEPMKKLMAEDERNLPINTFSMTRVYHDNKAFVLSNNHDWYYTSFLNQEHKAMLGYDYFDSSLKRFFWRDNNEYLKVRSSAIAVANQFIDVETALTVHVKTDNYSDRFIFSDQKKHNNLLETLINDPELANDVIADFYQKASSIIDEAQKYRFVIKNPLVKQESLKEEKVPAEAINSFLSIVLNREIKLNDREYVFLVNSICGIKPTTIAEKFFLSNRTVENILHQSRNKLNCKSSTQVFLLFSRTGVFNLYLQPILDNIILVD